MASLLMNVKCGVMITLVFLILFTSSNYVQGRFLPPQSQASACQGSRCFNFQKECENECYKVPPSKFKSCKNDCSTQNDNCKTNCNNYPTTPLE
ncbi:hypothetical protein OROGR_029301 [Orobanche gracilis]